MRYNNGMLFSNKLAENLRGQLDRVDDKKASLLIIDGIQGEGKTTLLVEAIDYVNSLRGHELAMLKLSDHVQLAMGGRQFLKYFQECKERGYGVIGYDEAGDFNRRGSMTQFNAMLNRVFTKYRGFKIIVILALPSFNVLDNDLFVNGIPRGLLHCHDRTRKYGNFSGYSLAQMNWVRYWHDKLPKGAKHKCYSKAYPNFRGHFLDIAPARSRQLDLLSTRSKDNSIVEEELRAEGYVTYTDLCRKMQRSHVWVREKLAELRIKPTKQVARVKYFAPVTLDRLADFLEIKRGRPRK